MTVLKIPNYSIRTIYWEYIELFTRNLNADIMLNTGEESAAINTRAQLEKYRRSSLFTGRDDVKFAALLFIGKDQYQLVPLL
jgi:hypothetical protein